MNAPETAFTEPAMMAIGSLSEASVGSYVSKSDITCESLADKKVMNVSNCKMKIRIDSAPRKNSEQP
jgi:hypothetical protein